MLAIFDRDAIVLHEVKGFSMKKSKATLDDIAMLAGVSRAAVSMILSKKMLNRFSMETIRKVQQAAGELKYRRNSLGFRSVLIVCPSVFNPYFSTMLQGMDMKAIDCGYRTMVYNTYWDLDRERAIIDLVKRHNIDGVVFAMIPQQLEVAAELKSIIPVVAVGDYHKDLQMDTVDINNHNAGRLLAAHLIGLGHRNLVYISTSLNAFHSARIRRLEGLRSVCEEKGNGVSLKVYSRDIEPVTEINNVNIEFETGNELARQCILESPDVTAVVAINDMVAYGVINAIQESGYRIPEDFSVCGFDNIFPSRFANISLTTVDHQIIEQGKRAIMLLRQRFEQDDSAREIVRVEYKCSLVVRNSSASPGKRRMASVPPSV